MSKIDELKAEITNLQDELDRKQNELENENFLLSFESHNKKDDQPVHRLTDEELEFFAKLMREQDDYTQEYHDKEDNESQKQENSDIFSFGDFLKMFEKIEDDENQKQTNSKTEFVKGKLLNLADELKHLNKNPKVKELDEKVRPMVENAIDFGQDKIGKLKDFVEEKIDFSSIQDKIESERKIFETKKFLEQFDNVQILDIKPYQFTVVFEEFGDEIYFTFTDEHTLASILFFDTDFNIEHFGKGSDNEYIYSVRENVTIDFPKGYYIENFGDPFELDNVVSNYYDAE